MLKIISGLPECGGLYMDSRNSTTVHIYINSPPVTPAGTYEATMAAVLDGQLGQLSQLRIAVYTDGMPPPVSVVHCSLSNVKPVASLALLAYVLLTSLRSPGRTLTAVSQV